MKVKLKTIFKMQTPTNSAPHRRLLDLAAGDSGVLEGLALPDSIAGHLLDLGFVPGCEITVVRSGPAGGPRVYRVDGTEVALRRDLAERITVRQEMAEC